MKLGPVLTLLFGVLASGLAAAQVRVVPETSDAARCLVATDPAQPAPEYPFEAFRKKEPGRVKVRLRLSAPDKPPRVEILETEGRDEFAQSVRRWTATLRAPCLVEGEAVLVQEYLFRDHEQPVVYDSPLDEEAQRRKARIGCLVNRSEHRTPDFPWAARQQEQQGRVFARLRFVDPDQPPEVELFHRRSARVLSDSVLRWSRDYRMPCLERGVDAPVVAHAVFEYRLEDQLYGFKPIGLAQLIGRVKGVREQTLQLDTNEMGCPFHVKFTYLRPGLPNGVGVVGEYLAAREPLLAWLRQVELDLPVRTLDSIYADTADVAVPCVRINLNPKEKTS